MRKFAWPTIIVGCLLIVYCLFVLSDETIPLSDVALPGGIGLLLIILGDGFRRMRKKNTPSMDDLDDGDHHDHDDDFDDMDD